ncbi:hypothetical protein [Pseudooceanicola nanhaiensis]|uniref:hypothetical protein n=1 Tax=Pseudooceanicola nanhaiensis TaxID=375761 RepID=UPI0040587D4D
MPAQTWTRRTLASLLDEKTPSEEVLRVAAPFTKMDLERMTEGERDAVLDAFRDAALRARQDHGGALTSEDVVAGLRAARAALEAVPQDERSNRAIRLLADCACVPAAPAES